MPGQGKSTHSLMSREGRRGARCPLGLLAVVGVEDGVGAGAVAEGEGEEGPLVGTTLGAR